MSKTINLYETMTNDEINKRMRELSNILDYGISDGWEKAYDEYFLLSAIMDERYRMENQEKFDAFYNEHIKGKSWEEIHPQDWQYYSDWHKDMYGFRPRHV